jgi:hypothetical protein
MSIEKYYGAGGVLYKPVCNICGNELPPKFEYREAARAKRDAGWIRRENGDGEQEDVCAECQGEERETCRS